MGKRFERLRELRLLGTSRRGSRGTASGEADAEGARQRRASLERRAAAVEAESSGTRTRAAPEAADRVAEALSEGTRDSAQSGRSLV